MRSFATGLFSVTALAALGACTSPQPASVICPVPVAYTKSQETQAADERAALPAKSILRTFLDDYGKERDKLRACRG